jgi:hypothetical protein
MYILDKYIFHSHDTCNKIYTKNIIILSLFLFLQVPTYSYLYEVRRFTRYDFETLY